MEPPTAQPSLLVPSKLGVMPFSLFGLNCEGSRPHRHQRPGERTSRCVNRTDEVTSKKIRFECPLLELFLLNFPQLFAVFMASTTSIGSIELQVPLAIGTMQWGRTWLDEKLNRGPFSMSHAHKIAWRADDVST